MQRDLSYVSDIVEAARFVAEFVRGVEQEDFMDDVMRQDAVIRQITVMGEATKQLSVEFRFEHSAVPWRKIAGMRDVVVHGYRGIDLREIWLVAVRNVPALLAELEPLMPPQPK